MRAISRLACRRRALFSSTPVAVWKCRLKSSCRVSAIFRSSSSSVSSRSSLALKEISLPAYELRLQRQLLAREPERLLGELLGHAAHLEHDAPGLDHGDPALRRALAGAHSGLRGLLRDGLVREEVDPDLPATADLPRRRDAGSLDLPVRHPAGLERLEAVVAELHGRLALRGSLAASPVVAAVLGLPRHQHQLPASVSGEASGAASGAVSG